MTIRFDNIKIQYLKESVHVLSSSKLKPSGEDVSPIYGSITIDACDKKKATVKNYSLISASTGATFDSHWSIDWGDGTTEGPFLAKWFTRSHTYSSYGTKAIQIIATPTSLSGLSSFTSTVSLNGCTNTTYRHKGLVRYSNDGQRAFKCVAEVVVSFLANKIYASTTAWKKKNNGKFREAKAERIAVQVQGDVLNSSCNVDRHASAADWPYNDKFCKAVYGMGIGSPFYWDAVYSNHRMWYNGEMYSQDLHLPVCQ